MSVFAAYGHKYVKRRLNFWCLVHFSAFCSYQLGYSLCKQAKMKRLIRSILTLLLKKVERIAQNRWCFMKVHVCSIHMSAI